MGQAISFKNRMGQTLTQVSKEDWEKAPPKKQGKRDQSKNRRKRDFDETHNSSLEKQRKAEVIHN